MKESKVFHLKISDLSNLHLELLKHIGEKTLVFLKGQVGAGKTTWVRDFLSFLEIPVQEVASPTFALIHQYHPEAKSKFQKTALYHVDLYRLESEEELDSSGFWDLLSENKYLIFIEWADKVPENWWPENVIKIELQIDVDLSAQQRRYQIFY